MTREHVFWALVGVAALALVACVVVWGGSVRADVRAEGARWKELTNKRAVLWAGRKKIPDRDSVQKRHEFNVWLRGQTQEVAAFFERRDKVLEKNLIEGDETPSPGDFKAEYNSLRSESVRHLRRQSMHVWNPDSVFKLYPWSVGEASPQPAEYATVRKDLWIRRYFILGVLPRNGVLDVSNLSVYPAQHMAGAEFDVIPVRIVCLLPPGNLVKLLDSLLTIPEGDAEKLFVVVRELSVKKGAGSAEKETPPISLELLVDLIDFQPKGK